MADRGAWVAVCVNRMARVPGSAAGCRGTVSSGPKPSSGPQRRHHFLFPCSSRQHRPTCPRNPCHPRTTGQPACDTERLHCWRNRLSPDEAVPVAEIEPQAIRCRGGSRPPRHRAYATHGVTATSQWLTAEVGSAGLAHPSRSTSTKVSSVQAAASRTAARPRRVGR